jgi:hypothetical protein
MDAHVFNYDFDCDNYDGFGETLRDDLEELIEFGQNAKVMIEIIYNTPDPSHKTFIYNIATGCCYDYIGENVRYELEDSYVNCKVKVTYQQL